MAIEEVRLPQPDDIRSREKEDAKGAYFMMFAALGVGLPLPVFNLVAAVIYFVINRKAFRFVAFHSLQSLLSLIVWLICILVTDLLFPWRFSST